MPQLGVPSLTTVILPSSSKDDPARVTIDLNLTGQHAKLFSSNKGDNLDMAFVVLASIITEWNFVDDAGEPVPITVDNVRLLSLTDFSYLSDIVERTVASTVNRAISTPEKKD